MKTLLSLILAIIFLPSTQLTGQREDNVWLFGASSINALDDFGYQHGNSIMDFSDVDPILYYDSLMTMDFTGTNASICDNAGNLLFYSNGMHIHNRMHQNIINGDTLAYSDFWENWSFKNYYPNGEDWIHGFPEIQGAIFLPLQSDNNLFAIIYKIREFDKEDNPRAKSLNYSIVTKNQEGFFEVSQKDNIIISDELNFGHITACRHANGRDWWVIQHTIEDDLALIFLASKQGIKLNSTFSKEARIPTTATIPQAVFSPDGSKYAIAEAQGPAEDRITVISLYNFNRCNGLLDFISRDTIINHRIHASLAFSPNSQYLYASSHQQMYQYDLLETAWIESQKLVAEYDGFYFQYGEFTSKWPTEFGPMALGPDGRIYSVPGGDNRFINAIEFPNEEGEASNMIQHKIMIPTENFRSVPNFPNFRLGPEDGSECDSLGIDNHPIALFRYAQDSSDHLNVRFTDLSYYRPESWTWDFGDGSSYDGKKPYFHQYEENGAYYVCLTLSNENSEHQYCKTIYLGVTATEDKMLLDRQVNIFPNPVEAHLYIELRDYLPQDAQLHIYNEMGQQQFLFDINGGWNNFEVASLPNGLYFYSIVDNGIVIYADKFVKIE